MKLHIIIPYRPTRGGMNSVREPIIQQDDFRWITDKGEELNLRPASADIDRAIFALEKNSTYDHKIIIAIDSDMIPHKDWFKDHPNIEIFRSNFICTTPEEKKWQPFFKLNATSRDAILACPDDAFICYAFISDLIVAKNWDKHLAIAHKAYGDDYTYTPMWVEPRGKPFTQGDNNITHHNIWRKWRERCCHCLIFPAHPNFDAPLTEAEFDNWIAVATEKHPLPTLAEWGDQGVILEPCGARVYGYFCAVCAKAPRLKKVARETKLGPGWDLSMEGALGQKAVCVNSFVLHLHGRFIFDDVRVEKSEPVL